MSAAKSFPDLFLTRFGTAQKKAPQAFSLRRHVGRLSRYDENNPS